MSVRRKTAFEQALDYSSKPTTYVFEDTGDRCYRDVIEVLDKSNWQRIPSRKKSKLVEKKKFPGKEAPALVWMLNENDVDFANLDKDTLCNHFEGIHHLTTKQGLCELSKEGYLINEDMNDIMPRSYNLGDPIHRDEFIDDFRLSCALNLLKIHFLSRIHFLLHTDDHSIPSVPAIPVEESVLRLAMSACIWHIMIHRDGLWPGIDEEFNSITTQSNNQTDGHSNSNNLSKSSKSSSNPNNNNSNEKFSEVENPLNDESWHKLTHFSYQLLRKQTSFDPEYDRLLPRYFTGDLNEDYHLSTAIKRNFTPLDYKIRAILHTFVFDLQKTHFFADGYRNLWVGKSPDSSCGIGIRIFYKLEDILDFERGMSGRTVQKYIETPLLSVSKQTLMYPFLPPSQQSHSNGGNPGSGWKFDLRIWVLVTSLDSPTPANNTKSQSNNNGNNVQAYVYNRFYGRRCGTTFTLNTNSFNQAFVHLTNYSVQKKKYTNNNSSSTTSNNNPSKGNSAIFYTDNNASNNANSSSTSTSKRSMVQRMRSFRQDTSASETSSATNEEYPDVADIADNTSVPQSDLLMSQEDVENIVEYHWLQQMQQGRFLDKALHQRLLRLHENAPSFDDHRDTRHTVDIWRQVIWPKVKRHIVQLLTLSSLKLTPRKPSFEFLGFDVLLDERMHPWVIEVNMSPAMAHRSQEQSRLIRQMSRGLVSLAVVPKLNVETRVAVLNALEYETTAVSSETVSEEEEAGDNGPNGDPGRRRRRGSSSILPNNLGKWESVYDHLPSATAAAADEEDSVVGRNTSSAVMSHPLFPVYRSPVQSSDSRTSGFNSNPNNPNYPNNPVMRPTRPKSASAVSRIRSVSSCVAAPAQNATSSLWQDDASVATQGGGLEIGFTLCGRHISATHVSYIDFLCQQVNFLLTIQRRVRLFLFHCRRFHFLRHQACLKIQCVVRCHQARDTLRHLKRTRAATQIQCVVRRKLAYKAHRLACVATHFLRHIAPERRLLRAFSRWFLCFLTNKKHKIRRFVVCRWRQKKWRHVLRPVLRLFLWFFRAKRRCVVLIQRHWRVFRNRRNRRNRIFQNFVDQMVKPFLLAKKNAQEEAVRKLLEEAKAQALLLLQLKEIEEKEKEDKERNERMLLLSEKKPAEASSTPEKDTEEQLHVCETQACETQDTFMAESIDETADTDIARDTIDNDDDTALHIANQETLKGENNDEIIADGDKYPDKGDEKSDNDHIVQKTRDDYGDQTESKFVVGEVTTAEPTFHESIVSFDVYVKRSIEINGKSGDNNVGDKAGDKYNLTDFIQNNDQDTDDDTTVSLRHKSSSSTSRHTSATLNEKIQKLKEKHKRERQEHEHRLRLLLSRHTGTHLINDNDNSSDKLNLHLPGTETDKTSHRSSTKKKKKKSSGTNKTVNNNNVYINYSNNSVLDTHNSNTYYADLKPPAPYDQPFQNVFPVSPPVSHLPYDTARVRRGSRRGVSRVTGPVMDAECVFDSCDTPAAFALYNDSHSNQVAVSRDTNKNKNNVTVSQEFAALGGVLAEQMWQRHNSRHHSATVNNNVHGLTDTVHCNNHMNMYDDFHSSNIINNISDISNNIIINNSDINNNIINNNSDISNNIINHNTSSNSNDKINVERFNNDDVDYHPFNDNLRPSSGQKKKKKSSGGFNSSAPTTPRHSVSAKRPSSSSTTSSALPRDPERQVQTLATYLQQVSLNNSYGVSRQTQSRDTGVLQDALSLLRQQQHQQWQARDTPNPVPLPLAPPLHFLDHHPERPSYFFQNNQNAFHNDNHHTNDQFHFYAPQNPEATHPDDVSQLLHWSEVVSQQPYNDDMGVSHKTQATKKSTQFKAVHDTDIVHHTVSHAVTSTQVKRPRSASATTGGSVRRSQSAKSTKHVHVNGNGDGKKRLSKREQEVQERLTHLYMGK